MEEEIRAPKVIPVMVEEAQISGCGHVIADGQNIERRGVGRSISVLEVRKPWHEPRRLGDFMFDLSIGTLKFGDKSKRRADRGKVPNRVEGQICPKRVPAEEPAKARTAAVAGGTVPRNQASAERRIIHQPLDQADPRPVISGLELRIRQFERNSLIQVGGIVLAGG